MTVIYFFFGHLSVFLVFFTSVGVALKMFDINLEKSAVETPDVISFLPSLEKFLFVGELLFKQLLTQSINKFLEGL